MDRHLAIRHLFAGLAAIVCMAAPAAGNELRGAAVQTVAGVVVHSAEETLQDYCRVENGVLTLVLPGGARYELITSTSDRALGNPGDGEFHPFDAVEVRAALAEVDFPLQRVNAEVFILPYPRRASLESAAGHGIILLSPGVRRISRAAQHSEFVHELGHVVQYAMMPDADEAAWTEYRRLRGLCATNNTADASHARRPHEIFAEDFRALFGGETANATGTIENDELVHPAQVSGLEQFMASRATAAEARLGQRLTAAAFSTGKVSFSRFGVVPAVLDVFDAMGRRLATLQPTTLSNGATWVWDGHGADGAAMASGVYFARVRDGLGGAARVTIVR
jgi:hypothetical protein